MDGSTKTGRWSIRVTADQDAVVRRVVEESGESLNDFVVRNCVMAAQNDLADRRVFVVDDAGWTQLQALLDAPPVYRPELAKLLSNPSVLEEGGQAK